MHTTVRWLSLEKTLKRVFLLRRKFPNFCKIRGTRMLVIFMIHTFLLALNFLLMFLNTLINFIELQGKSKWLFDFQSSIKGFVSNMQKLLEEAETDNYSHFCHFQEFNATINIDFYKELDLKKAKKDLNLTGNMNARLKDVIVESSDFA